jgi:hypothetical protein
MHSKAYLLQDCTSREEGLWGTAEADRDLRAGFRGCGKEECNSIMLVIGDWAEMMEPASQWFPATLSLGTEHQV